MLFHHQNLNEKGHGLKGSLLRHGRCWLKWADLKSEIEFEWHLTSRTACVKVDVGGIAAEDEITFKLAFPPVALYLTFRDPLFDSLVERCGGRATGVTFLSPLHVNFELWNTIGGWCRGQPKWWSNSIDFTDLLLGKAETTITPLDIVDVGVPMPEGNYPAQVKIRHWSRSRPRWHWPIKQHIISSVEMKEPIPVPGKGESSWNCDDGDVHSATFPVSTPAQAVAEMVKTCLRTRERYASLDWTPRKTFRQKARDRLHDMYSKRDG